MKIDMKLLQKELQAASAYQPEERSAGYRYIYDKLYLPFVREEEIAMETLDFTAFSSEDVLEFDTDFYSRINRSLSRNIDIKRRLRKTQACASAARFL